MGRATTKQDRAARKEHRRNAPPKTTALTTEDGKWVPSVGMGAGRWVRDHLGVGNAATFGVAMGLLLRTDETLVCWPKMDTLATDLNSSPATLDRQFVLLEQANMVRIIHLFLGNTQLQSLYVFNLQWWLDDAPDLIARVQHVRALALETGAQANELPPGSVMRLPRPRQRKHRAKAAK